MAPMKFRHELAYDAPPAAVFEMLADPEFRQAACAAQDVISAEVTLEREGNGFTLTVDQEQRTDDLSSFARTFAGASTRAIQRERWADTYFELAEPHDEFGYLDRAEIAIMIDSKENFENNYAANWWYYFK